jgi:hypothetical protein
VRATHAVNLQAISIHETILLAVVLLFYHNAIVLFDDFVTIRVLSSPMMKKTMFDTAIIRIIIVSTCTKKILLCTTLFCRNGAIA